MLMSHSSGLYYGDIQQGARNKAGNAGAGIIPAIAANRASRTSLKALSESLAKQPLKFHPGTSYQYGHGIDVLGRYIEAVAGKPLDEVLQERILGPLKMTSTDFWVHPENADRICQIYKQPKPGVLERGREAAQLTEKPTLFMGGQGLCASTEDYERFCRMMLNRGELDGVRVLKPETVDLMFENHLGRPPVGELLRNSSPPSRGATRPQKATRPQTEAHSQIKVAGMKYGLGGAVDGDGGYSWGGANGTQFWLDRKNNLFAIFMVQTQQYRASTYGIFKSLVNESAGIAMGREVGSQGQGGAGAQGQSGGTSAMSRQFQQRDKNNDGKLTRDELPAALFDKLDADKDRFVTEDELNDLRKPE
jgi:CubicO group peptidase (beta-lactamase class C family)